MYTITQVVLCTTLGDAVYLHGTGSSVLQAVWCTDCRITCGFGLLRIFIKPDYVHHATEQTEFPRDPWDNFPHYAWNQVTKELGVRPLMPGKASCPPGSPD